jgi:hypothetical protein
VPLLGGEKAVYDVRRIAFALAEMTGGGVDYFKENERELFRKMMPRSGTRPPSAGCWTAYPLTWTSASTAATTASRP